MVDFDNEATVGVPAIDIERISILERRYNLIEALEDYKKKQYKGIGVDLSAVRARLFSLFMQLQGTFKRRLKDKPQEYDDLLKGCLESDKEKDILKHIYYISELLDELRITRVDMKRTYDERNVEKENKIKGF